MTKIDMKELFMQETALCVSGRKGTQKVCAVCSLQILPSMKHTCELQWEVSEALVGAGARGRSESHNGILLPT